ncbi:unnamed protein product [Effrenium voratum]|nr:unnamed protein product [Effrenium voratum]
MGLWQDTYRPQPFHVLGPGIRGGEFSVRFDAELLDLVAPVPKDQSESATEFELPLLLAQRPHEDPAVEAWLCRCLDTGAALTLEARCLVKLQKAVEEQPEVCPVFRNLLSRFETALAGWLEQWPEKEPMREGLCAPWLCSKQSAEELELELHSVLALVGGLRGQRGPPLLPDYKEAMDTFRQVASGWIFKLDSLYGLEILNQHERIGDLSMLSWELCEVEALLVCAYFRPPEMKIWHFARRWCVEGAGAPAFSEEGAERQAPWGREEIDAAISKGLIWDLLPPKEDLVAQSAEISRSQTEPAPHPSGSFEPEPLEAAEPSDAPKAPKAIGIFGASFQRVERRRRRGSDGLGWRSWNLYNRNVNQSLMEAIMDGMVSKKRQVDGVPTSLCDLGYCDVGLDDNWQNCDGGQKYHYHGDSGIPIINQSRFPDMVAMTAHAHRLGLTAGWYLNNCICSEGTSTDAMYQSDVAALTVFNFDGVKLDGCGKQLDLDKWAQLLNGTGRKVLIENCHWGRTVPNATWCPWNFFRTSGDVRASYGSVVGNLQTTTEWAQKNLSRPGCWGYPDMLEVGVPGLSYQESRSHFAAWAIVSSPLVLSMDVNNDKVMDDVWDIISNKEILAVNQAWAGHSGSPFKQANRTVQLPDYFMRIQGVVVPYKEQVHSWQFFYKPVGDNKVAVLLMNHDTAAQDLVLNFSEVPGLKCQKCQVRCLFKHKDLGSHETSFTSKSVASHDSRMFLLSDASVEFVYACNFENIISTYPPVHGAERKFRFDFRVNSGSAADAAPLLEVGLMVAPEAKVAFKADSPHLWRPLGPGEEVGKSEPFHPIHALLDVLVEGVRMAVEVDFEEATVSLWNLEPEEKEATVSLWNLEPEGAEPSAGDVGSRPRKRATEGVLANTVLVRVRSFRSISFERGMGISQQLAGDVRSHQAAVGAFGKASKWQQALEVLWALPAASLEPNVIIYSMAISACEKGGSWQSALLLLEGINENTVEFVWRFQPGGSQSPAFQPLSHQARDSPYDANLVLPLQDVICFNSAISACAKAAAWTQAVDLFRHLQSSLQPDVISYNAVISACERSEQWELALQVLQDIGRRQIEASIISFNTAASACGRAEQWQQSLRLFTEAQDRKLQSSMVSITAAIDACGAGGCWQGALELVLLSAFSLAACNAAISACGDNGRWRHALDIFSQLRSLQPDIITCSAMISAYEKGCEWQRACGALEDLRSRGLRPNIISFGSLISACEKGGEWQRALGLLEELRAVRLEPNDVVCNSAISACANRARWQLALLLLEELLVKDAADVISFSAAISACEEEGKWRHALQLLEELSLRVRANVVAFSAACSACAKGYRWQASLALFSQLQVAQLQPTVASYDACLLLGTFASARQF